MDKANAIKAATPMIPTSSAIPQYDPARAANNVAIRERRGLSWPVSTDLSYLLAPQ
jgi:hypothetical protein